MKHLILISTAMLFSTFAIAQSTKLDANSIQLANVLVQDEIRHCIDSALKDNGAYGNEGLDVTSGEIFITEDPLFPGSSTLQQITHYLLQTRTLAKPNNGSLKMIKIIFDIKIASGTGILNYSCSSQAL